MIDDALWSELESSSEPPVRGRVQRRIHPESGNDILAATSYPEGQRMLVVSAPADAFAIAARLLKERRDVRGLMVDVEVIDHSRSELRIVLTSRDLEPVFTPLARDISDIASMSRAERVVLDALERYARWQELLRTIGADGLSLESRRGLFGELYVLREHLLPNLASIDAVHAWTGPGGTDQDFQLANCAIEVKTTKRRSPATVSITSERQLEDLGTSDLFLTAIVVDERRGGTGESLPDVVTEIRAALTTIGVRSEFDLSLAQYGYFDHHRERYEEPRYTVVSSDIWRVEEGFPRLTTKNVPSGVHRCRYEIALDSLAPFLVSTADLLNSVKG